MCKKSKLSKLKFWDVNISESPRGKNASWFTGKEKDDMNTTESEIQVSEVGQSIIPDEVVIPLFGKGRKLL